MLCTFVFFPVFMGCLMFFTIFFAVAFFLVCFTMIRTVIAIRRTLCACAVVLITAFVMCTAAVMAASMSMSHDGHSRAA